MSQAIDAGWIPRFIIYFILFYLFLYKINLEFLINLSIIYFSFLI